jgi:hypothetical protein
MALPTWTHDALRSEQYAAEQTCWRCVEAQHIVSTLSLVDTLEDQTLLEEILEETKPPVPRDCERLHYLYMTPFRYGLYPSGSRFRRAGRTPGVYYVSEHVETAVIETAFHILLFYAESPATPFPANPSEHTVFDVPVSTSAAIDLTQPPWVHAAHLWCGTADYDGCQSLEQAARENDIELIRYLSVRDPTGRCNAVLLGCAAFAAPAPSRRQSWRILLNRAGVHAIGGGGEARLSLGTDTFAKDPRLADFRWVRAD